MQQCLGDGVRLPMQDLKRLEVENTQLLEQQDHSSRVALTRHESCTRMQLYQKPLTLMFSASHQLFKHQKEQIERLTSQLTVGYKESFFVNLIRAS